MKLISSIYISAMVAVAFPALAFAGDGARYDRAKVISVEPIVRSVHVSTPMRDCWYEGPSYNAHYESATPAILGGIVGGVIGHQFGKGRGNNAATVAGTLLGASIGHDAGRNVYTGSRNDTKQHCRVQHESWSEERIVGYHVTYRYHGQIYHTRMNRDPGDRVRVRVNVTVVD